MEHYQRLPLKKAYHVRDPGGYPADVLYSKWQNMEYVIDDLTDCYGSLERYLLSLEIPGACLARIKRSFLKETPQNSLAAFSEPQTAPDSAQR
ncbi:MAG: hypothetical protein LBQ15_06560 [Clostridium sp.]|jgi:hypothetical protein|nr:hypothetical protein [Clostridium sp.]